MSTSRDTVYHPSIPQLHPSFAPYGSQSKWRERRNVLGDVAFIAVLLTTLFDLNAVLSTLTGRIQLASPVLLVCCILSYVALRFRFGRALGPAGIWFVGAYAVFLLVGTAIRLLGEFDQTEIFILTYWWRLHFTSIVILLALAVSTRYFVLRHSAEKTLFIVFCVMMLQVLATLFSDQLSAISISEKNAHYDSIGRSTGLLGNPNATGNLMVATAAVGFGCLLWGKWRSLVLVGLAATAIACISTFSRSSWIAFFLVASTQVFYSPIVRKKAALVGSALIVVGLLWFVSKGVEKVDLNEKQQKRTASFLDIFSGEFDEDDTGSRFVMAAIGLQLWSENPIGGVGLGKGGRMETDYGLTLGPHNHYILILVESGLMGLIPYLIFFGVTIWSAWKCPSIPTRTFVLGYMVAFICHNLTGHNVPTHNYHAALLGIAFGMLSAATYAEKQKSRRPAVRPQTI